MVKDMNETTIHGQRDPLREITQQIHGLEYEIANLWVYRGTLRSEIQTAMCDGEIAGKEHALEQLYIDRANMLREELQKTPE